MRRASRRVLAVLLFSIVTTIIASGQTSDATSVGKQTTGIQTAHQIRHLVYPVLFAYSSFGMIEDGSPVLAGVRFPNVLGVLSLQIESGYIPIGLFEAGLKHVFAGDLLSNFIFRELYANVAIGIPIIRYPSGWVARTNGFSCYLASWSISTAARYYYNTLFIEPNMRVELAMGLGDSSGTVRAGDVLYAEIGPVFTPLFDRVAVVFRAGAMGRSILSCFGFGLGYWFLPEPRLFTELSVGLCLAFGGRKESAFSVEN